MFKTELKATIAASGRWAAPGNRPGQEAGRARARRDRTENAEGGLTRAATGTEM